MTWLLFAAFRLRFVCLAVSAGGTRLANVQPQPDKMVGPVAS